MSSEQMKGRIGAQAASLRRVLEHHCVDGSNELQEAAELIRSKGQVVITGMGASFYAALPLESHLCGLGIHAIAVEAGELLHFRRHSYPDAVVLVVSRSGESIEIAKLLDALGGRQKVIGVSNRHASRLAHGADVFISIHSLDDDIVALQTYTGTVLTLALLGRAVEGKLEEARNEVEGFMLDFEKLVDSSLASLRDWDEFLCPGASVYLLARGGSFASALEGALLFHEVSKAPAIAMLTASFRHGPVEVVDSDFRAFVFVPKGSTQPLNVALARDLVSFGGDVLLIGPQASNTEGLRLIETPVTDALYAPLFEVIPVQAAALRLAEVRGIVPGSFRFASPVALDESSFGTPSQA